MLKLQNRANFGVVKISNIFWVLKIPDILFEVKGRCWARVPPLGTSPAWSSSRGSRVRPT